MPDTGRGAGDRDLALKSAAALSMNTVLGAGLSTGLHARDLRGGGHVEPVRMGSSDVVLRRSSPPTQSSAMII
jgi:hypothetical protein